MTSVTTAGYISFMWPGQQRCNEVDDDASNIAPWPVVSLGFPLSHDARTNKTCESNSAAIDDAQAESAQWQRFACYSRDRWMRENPY